MGASVVYGLDLFRRETMVGGDKVTEIRPREGGSVNISYGSVEALIRYCEERGVPREYWPVFYNVSVSDLELMEVSLRCDRLQEALSAMSNSECKGASWLREIKDWLDGGMKFVILE